MITRYAYKLILIRSRPHLPPCYLQAQYTARKDSSVPDVNPRVPKSSLHPFQSTTSFRKMQIIRQPLPRINLRNIQSGLTIRQRQKEEPAPQHGRNDQATSPPQRQHPLLTQPLLRRHDNPLARAVFILAGRFDLIGLLKEVLVEAGRVKVKDEFEEGAADEGGGEVGGEVVVQEELAAHEVEGEVVRGPAEEEEARAVVESGACSCV